MDTKHTPGPWELDGPTEAHVTSEDYHVICAGCGFLAEAKDVRELGFRIAGHMTEADARLITAAPELLVALNSARVAIDMLMAQLVEVDPSLKPKQSAVWLAVAAIDAALNAAGPA